MSAVTRNRHIITYREQIKIWGETAAKFFEVVCQN